MGRIFWCIPRYYSQLFLPPYSAVFRAPQHPRLQGATDLGREWEKFRLELKRAIPGYATDVFVMLGDWLCGGEG